MTKYCCVHLFCIQHFGNIDSWTTHVLQHNNFRSGFICDDCQSFIYNFDATNAVQTHNYLSHGIPFDYLDESHKATHICPWKGSVWCSACNQIVDLGGEAQYGHMSQELVEHLANHLLRDESVFVKC
ncbi:hypothetical protein BDW75DRAFT_248407 [Aspergillus navahoensis]